MKRTNLKQVVNNLIYVEPNYINSVDEFDVNGTNTHEFTPPLEDYSLYVNLEVDVRGRTVQTTKTSNSKKLILSFETKTDGKSTINFMQGSKIPIGENGVYLNSLTTNYTDIYLGDLKKIGPSTETFGIQSIDIAYNNFMVPEVTVEFIDVRGVALFAQKEYYETNKKIDEAISSGNDTDIANTFFQCFFTFPYPKFTLMVKGFYGEPVSYELTVADFRARFDSNTGNFACTAKFVGYYFSFLNDVMLNGIIAAPYSDYIGAKYWESQNFQMEGKDGGLVPVPKIGWLLRNIKNIESTAEKMAQSDPVAQEKTQLDQKKDYFTKIENSYNNFVEEINKSIGKKLSESKNVSGDQYKGVNIVARGLTNNGYLSGLVLLSPSENDEEFCDYVDNEDQLKGRYDDFIEELKKYNSEHPNETLPTPNKFYDSEPRQRISNQPNSETKAQMGGSWNDDIKKTHPQVYNKLKIYVNNGNKENKNPLLEYKKAYFYDDNGFSYALEKYKDKNAKETERVEQEIEDLKDKVISEALGFSPTVENMTKIVMAHFETFIRMIFETSKTICNQEPKRTIQSLGINDATGASDVKSPNNFVPPFPKVVKEVRRKGSVIKEEAWVGDYSGDFREKDLVHGIINGIKQISKDVQSYENKEAGSAAGSESSISAISKYPLTPLDMIATENTYASGGFDENEPSSILGLVGLRGVQILGTTNFEDWGEKAETLGEAEACNFLKNNKLNKEMIQKLSLLADNLDSVMSMMYGNETNDIKKPEGGVWPWRLRNDGGIISTSGDLDICRVKYDSFSVPYQNLSWSKIMNEVVNCENGIKAMRSEDYLNTVYIPNVKKKNIFTFDTNVNKFYKIAESQLTGIDGIDYYSKKIIDESKYDSNKYESYLTDEANRVIAYIIENAYAITPSDGSCMLPTSKKAFSDKSFGRGYNMDYFHDKEPGGGGSGTIFRDGWLDKDKKEVVRKGSDGYKKYLEEFNNIDYTFTEFCGVLTNLKPYTETVGSDPETSIFGQQLYYKQSDNRSRALLFLASLGYAIDYKEIIDNFFAKKEKTMAVIPLPGVMFAGALLWSETTEGKQCLNGYNTGWYGLEIKNLNALHRSVKSRLIEIFLNWVSTGVEGNSLLCSFNSIRSGMEIKLIKRPDKYDEFFENIGEVEDEGALGLFGGNSWIKKFDNSYNNIIDFLKGELSDDFFKNYITIDEDVCGSTKNFTRGLRLGVRDGGASSVHACNFALAGCVFSKNSKYFNDESNVGVKVNTSELKRFFKGFLDKVKENKVEDEDTNVQISQAKEPDDSNVDIKIGIYRYCKLLYDKWIAGITEEEFKEKYTMKEFFESDTRYFYFIDAFYNESNFILINIGNYCDEIVNSYRNSQYSLLSFLSSIYAKNKFSIYAINNFLDLSKKENMENMFDIIPYTDRWHIKKHPNFIVVYAYEASSHLADLDNSEYENDGFMINQEQSTTNIWPEPLKAHSEDFSSKYIIPCFGVSYGKMYQSYFKDINISMDSPTVTEQSIKAQFAIACQNNEGDQTGDRSKLFTYGQDLYSIYSNNSYSCEVTMMGCAWVQPMMYFVLNNVPMFRGTYYIIRVSHNITPGNMVTKFTGVRMSNVCTRIARDGGLRAKNNQSGKGETNSENSEALKNNANIDNDCEYKEFPLTNEESNNGASEDLAKKIKKAEGGYSDDKDDKGGCTMKGITIKTYRSYYGNDKTCNDLKNITDEEWNHIFKKGFWDKWRADEIKNKSIANLLVDWLYNSGPKHGIGKPQQILGLHQTYKVTDKEINAINSYSNQRELFNKIWNRRKEFFISIAKGSQKKFLKGWLNRLNEFTFSETYENVQVARNGDKHVSDLSTGFVNALNRTAASSTNNVKIGIDPERSKGDTVYITGGGSGFDTVFDMMLNTYSSKISEITWVIPNGGDQSSTPKEYIVKLKEGSSVTNIKVANESSPNTPINSIHVSKGDDNSGIHTSFCKALVKKYKSNTNELRSDTNNVLDDYDALFNDSKYKLQPCGGSASSSNDSGNNASQLGEGGKENESGFIGNWNVGLFVKRLHYWAENHCETEHKKNPKRGKRDKPGGSCHLCTGSINRALDDSGTNRKYWGGEPWEVYDKMKKSGSEFTEVTGGTSSNKSEFPFGQKVNKGDICVMWQSGRKPPRHSCAFDGSDWYSDFKQNGVCNVYKGRNNFNLEWHLFRHK